MRKKIFGGITVLTIALLSMWNVSVSLNSQKKIASYLTLEQLSANAGIIDDLTEWWNRNDWKCVEIPCSSILGIYKRWAPEQTAPGQGTEAHSWACTGCDS